MPQTLKVNETDGNGYNDVVCKRNGMETMRSNSSLETVVSGVLAIPYTKFLPASDIKHNTGTDLSAWSKTTTSFHSNAVKQIEVKTDRVILVTTSQCHQTREQQQVRCLQIKLKGKY